MPPKAKTTDEPLPPGATISGKWLIIGVLSIAVAGAAISWYFRYHATHQAAVFWGPQNARLIRDATHVELIRLRPATNNDVPDKALEIAEGKYKVAARTDVTSAHGLSHLRNALLEDHSFAFDAELEPPAPNHLRWALEFRDGNESATILFPEPCETLQLEHGNGAVVSCAPIAGGLREMFEEFSSNATSKSTANTGKQSR